MRTDARFYYVWNPEGNKPSRPHVEKRDAVAEANRLATANPGQTYFVVRPIGFARVDPKPASYIELIAGPESPEPRDQRNITEY